MIRFFSLVLLITLAPALIAQDKKPSADKKDPKDTPIDGLKALRHPEAEVRFKAAAVLVKLGPIGKFASAALREAFSEEKDLVVKVKMAEAIWEVDRPPTGVILPFLQEALKAKEAEVRRGAAGVIGQMGPKAKAAVPLLLDTLKDKDITTRIAAIIALGEIGTAAKSAAGPLLAAIQEENKDLLIDAMVASALGKFGPSVVPTLRAALADKFVRRRLAAVYALGEMGPPAADAVPALADLLKTDEELGHLMVLQALGKIGKAAQKAAPAVEPLVKSPSAATRLEAAQTLFLIDGQTKHLPILLECLTDVKLGLVEEACLAIKRFGPQAKEAAKPLAEKLKSRNLHIRMAAALALFHVTGKADEALAIFGDTLDETDNSIRRRTLEFLEEMGPAALPLLPAIQEAARDENDAVRHAAKAALAKVRKG